MCCCQAISGVQCIPWLPGLKVNLRHGICSHHGNVGNQMRLFSFLCMHYPAAHFDGWSHLCCDACLAHRAYTLLQMSKQPKIVGVAWLSTIIKLISKLQVSDYLPQFVSQIYVRYLTQVRVKIELSLKQHICNVYITTKSKHQYQINQVANSTYLTVPFPVYFLFPFTNIHRSERQAKSGKVSFIT